MRRLRLQASQQLFPLIVTVPASFSSNDVDWSGHILPGRKQDQTGVFPKGFFENADVKFQRSGCFGRLDQCDPTAN